MTQRQSYNQFNVYSADGTIVDTITLNDNVTFVGGRVSKGSKHYYKGVGIPYRTHYLDRGLFDNNYQLVKDPDVFYLGLEVSKKQFQNKFGVFQEKYQPQFSDYIGTCGVKELDIIGNSLEFERSSVEVIKSHNYDKVNNQYYFELRYKCNRQKYLDGGISKNLYQLIEYMIKTNWNFIWDKNTIADISYNGLVSDVGDIFQSSSLTNKIGTVYSILYSLGKSDKQKYDYFLKYAKLTQTTDMDYVFNTIALLQRFGVDLSSIIKEDHKQTYINVVLNYLVVGRNCGHCSYVDLGDKIKDKYIEQTKRQLNMAV